MTTVSSPGLERYRGLVSSKLLSEIYEYARILEGTHVLHINTTAQGGGVAALLNVLVPLSRELGVPHEWKVAQLDLFSANFMAKLTDMLQGGEPGQVTPDEHQRFLESLRKAMEPLQDARADVYYIHDVQLTPLGCMYDYMRPAVWFNHIDSSKPNENALQYIEQFLDVYAICSFNTPFSVFHNLRPGQTAVITLGIDPFDQHHREMSEDEGKRILSNLGIDTRRPLITQVSRFGKWKDPWQVIDIYRLVKQQLPQVQVALVGAMEASDDIKAQEVLRDLQKSIDEDHDIHLFSDPRRIQADQVNAFQRFSDVILQRSRREGFGLTVTEAMWKYQPVIGTSATGVRYQVTHGQDGFIADDPAEAAKYALQLIQDRDLRARLGRAAHQHVQTHFLLPMMLHDYLNTLVRALHRD